MSSRRSYKAYDILVNSDAEVDGPAWCLSRCNRYDIREPKATVKEEFTIARIGTNYGCKKKCANEQAKA